MEQEGMCMTDKQYDGMLKDQIASLDRIAKITKDAEGGLRRAEAGSF